MMEPTTAGCLGIIAMILTFGLWTPGIIDHKEKEDTDEQSD